jgi:hypothetical protein
MKETVRHPPWTPRAALLAAAIAAAGALAGCGGGGGEPVARLAVQPGRLELPYGTYAELRFRWTPRAELDGAQGSPRVFAHLVDEGGDLVRTFDHDLAGTWRAGAEMAYDARVYQSLLAPPLPPGTYTLTAGLYDSSGGGRWPLDTEGEAVGRNEYRVGTFEVPASSGEAASVPAVLFGPAWSPTLAGADRQVIAFRWLSEDGSIRLEDVPGAGTLWLSLGVPGEQAGSLRRRIVDPPGGGDGVPRVDVMASCSGFEAQISGEGTHDVEVPVEPSEGGCEITLDPNYVMVSPNGDRRTLVLQVLAWRPAETRSGAGIRSRTARP